MKPPAGGFRRGGPLLAPPKRRGPLCPPSPCPTCILRDAPVPLSVGYDSTLPGWPGYTSSLSKQAGLPPGSSRLIRRRPPPDAQIARAVFETLDPAVLRPWMLEAEWEIVGTITDPQKFRRDVLLDDFAALLPAARPSPGAQRSQANLFRKLEEAGYLVRLGAPTAGEPPPSPPPLPCGVFLVPKSDGLTWRMIWNGIEFNAVCAAPPHTPIRPLEEQLRVLLDERVHSFLAFDFQTWFCQLQVHAEIKEWFATRGPDGNWFLVRGVPMGWAWACSIAHTLTMAFTRAVCESAGLTIGVDLVVEHCIDNTIFGVIAKVDPKALYDDHVRPTAARFGIVLKDSATEHGPTVDWLCYKLSAESHRAEFKDAYVGKLRQAQAQCRRPDHRKSWSLAEVWSLAGLAVFSAYAARSPLTQHRPLIEWLAASVPQDHAEWSVGRTAKDFAAVWRVLWDALSRLTGVQITPPPPIRGPVLAWSVSDAALSSRREELNVNITFTPAGTTLCVYPCAADAIAERELCAALAGQPQRHRDAGLVVMFGDNTTANAALRRGWALWSAESERLEEITEGMEAAGVCRLVYYVPTDKCIADAWTRPFEGRKTGVFHQRRTCDHPFEVGRICTCVEQWLRDTGAPSERLDAWLREPPTFPPVK